MKVIFDVGVARDVWKELATSQPSLVEVFLGESSRTVSDLSFGAGFPMASGSFCDVPESIRHQVRGEKLCVVSEMSVYDLVVSDNLSCKAMCSLEDNEWWDLSVLGPDGVVLFWVSWWMSMVSGRSLEGEVEDDLSQYLGRREIARVKQVVDVAYDVPKMVAEAALGWAR